MEKITSESDNGVFEILFREDGNWSAYDYDLTKMMRVMVHRYNDLIGGKENPKNKTFNLPSSKDFKTLRKNTGMTMREVSRRSGINLNTISRIEAGKETNYSPIVQLIKFYQE